MIRQLGKPTIFLTMSASEYIWANLLNTLYKLKHGKTFLGNIMTDLSADERTTLVNEDPVASCIYFDKLINTIMFILRSKSSPFGNHRIYESFKRIEFQQRGSPHSHILIWLLDDPNEAVSEDMPKN